MPRFVFCLLVAGCTLAEWPAHAQEPPPTLLGTWRTRKIQFSLREAVPLSVIDQLYNPEFNEFIHALSTKEARVVVEFRADSSYKFTIVRNGQVQRTETGTFSLRHNHLSASAPGSPDGSSFHDQQVQLLTQRRLLLSFPMGPEFPNIDEEVDYQRIGPPPSSTKK